MATLGLIEYTDASPEVRAVYDDIMATRKTDWINNFWKAIAHDPATLKRTWEDIKQIMALRCGKRDQSMQLLHRFAHRRSPEERHD
jgi:glutathionylspermidine synthase